MMGTHHTRRPIADIACVTIKTGRGRIFQTGRQPARRPETRRQCWRISARHYASVRKVEVPAVAPPRCRTGTRENACHLQAFRPMAAALLAAARRLSPPVNVRFGLCGVSPVTCAGSASGYVYTRFFPGCGWFACAFGLHCVAFTFTGNAIC